MEANSKNPYIIMAVLPFNVLSDDARVEMFCQGLVMDMITDLSRFRSFHIIAHDTTKVLHPNEQPGSPLLDNLHLDYLVKGMVRHQQGKLSCNLQLINVAQNRLVWAEKFSGSFDEMFRIQEDVVEKIVVSLQHFVDYDLLNEVRKKPLTNWNVYEYWLKGYQELKTGTLEADEKARQYFQQAMELDPHYPRAYTGMSLSFFNEWSCQLWHRWEVSRNGAFEWAQKALDLDEWDHVSNAILGRIYLFNGDYEKGEHYLRKSMRINPNDAETLVLIAFGLTYLGYANEAREIYERVRRLNPADNFHSLACGAFVHFENGEVESAISLAERHNLSRGWVDFPAFQAAAYFLKGDLQKMRESWNVFIDEFSKKINGGKPADTQTALQWMINVNPYRGETQLKPFWEYMSQNDIQELVVDKPQALTLRQNCFRQENDLWTMAYGGKQVQLPDLKGYADLARLLSQPNRAVHCTDLMGAQALEKGETVFDEKAKAAYQKRILALQAEIEEAEDSFNSERLAELQEEYDQLIEHLSQATGKGGRARKVAGTVEKCRSAVTWRIRNAIKKIAESHPALGKHLEVSIKTGIFCEYTPEHETDWIVQ